MFIKKLYLTKKEFLNNQKNNSDEGNSWKSIFTILFSFFFQ